MRLDATQAARAQRARTNLEDEISKSAATFQQKAFMRQRLAQLWDVFKHLGVVDG
jgi:hypothetical protein